MLSRLYIAHASDIAARMLGGEMMTGVMADEILQPGPGRVRAANSSFKR